MKKSAILIYDGKITNVDPIINLVSNFSTTGQELVIITSDIDEASIMNLVMYKINFKVNTVVVKAPHRGNRRTETLEDIATLVGAHVISEEKGHQLSQVRPSMLGSCEKLVVTKKDTTIINGKGSATTLSNRIDELTKSIETFDTEYEQGIVKERIAKLKGGVAILYVGAVSEVELKEKRDRVDDALSATRAAIEEGIVIGGGLVLIRASQSCYKTGNNDEKIGAQIVLDAITEPFKQIIRNGGGQPEVILQKILDGKNKTAGYDSKNEIYVDMIKEGIIDPAKVVRVALENAASVAGMILTTDCALLRINESDNNFQIM